MLYTLPLLMAVGCDTTEEAYWPGPEPTDVISVDVAEIRLNADGTPQDLNISAICSWNASLADNENVFKISPVSGRGDGRISVSAEANYGGQVKSSTLEIQAVNFSKRVTVSVMQSALTFEMEDKEYPVTGEEGGSIDLSFNSTTAWEFVVRSNGADTNDMGSLDWLDFTPGFSGVGDFYTTEVIASWKPNYTQEERVITLVLTPSNQKILEYLTTTLPQPFTLRQKAGTLPTNVAGDTVSVGRSDAVYRLQYESKSPVAECGVRVMNVYGEEVTRVDADRSGDSYPQSGTVGVSIGGLNEGSRYVLVPYVRNMVGETVGSSMEIRTKSDSPIVYEGVDIIDYEIIPSSRSVAARVTVESDIDVYEIGMGIYTEAGQAEPSLTYALATSGNSFTVEVSSEDVLIPNTEGELVIFARTSVNESRTERIPFKTKGMTPSEDDNTPPDIR